MRIAPQISAAIVAHARFEAPNEACGLLALDDAGCITMAYPLTNVAASPVAFTIDPEEHFRALMSAEHRGWSIGGVFHSHPRTPAAPSRTDISGALDPTWVHLIVSLADGVADLRAWRIRHGNAVEEPVEMGVMVPCH